MWGLHPTERNSLIAGAVFGLAIGIVAASLPLCGASFVSEQSNRVLPDAYCYFMMAGDLDATILLLIGLYILTLPVLLVAVSALMPFMHSEIIMLLGYVIVPTIAYGLYGYLFGAWRLSRQCKCAKAE